VGKHGVCWKRAKTGAHRFNLEDFMAWLWLAEGFAPASGLNVNPDWLDWFMGFPIGWTACALEETPSSPPLVNTLEAG
jgi:hypothetical protein